MAKPPKVARLPTDNLKLSGAGLPWLPLVDAAASLLPSVSGGSDPK